MKSLSTILTFCFLQPLFAADFDAWYFKYHATPVTITGGFLTSDGNKVFDVSGQRTGKFSSDRESFIEESIYKFGSSDVQTPQRIDWKKTEVDKVFTGSSVDPNGIAISYRMTIEDESNLRIESKAVDGRALTERAKLDPEGEIHIAGVMHSKAGEPMFQIKYVLSKARENQPGDKRPDQPATAEEFKPDKK